MRTIEGIKADMQKAELAENCEEENCKYDECELWKQCGEGHELWCELINTITDGIDLDRLEQICQAERDGRLVVLPCNECEWADSDGVCFAEFCEEPIEQPKRVRAEAVLEREGK